MRVLVAPQEFKGTLTARQAAEAIARALREKRPDWQVDLAPLADGGPGTLEALVDAAGGTRETVRVLDPLGRPVDADYGVLKDGRAVIEMAQASGLWRLSPEERDLRHTSTWGTGQLIRAALERGCTDLLIGVGGSATNDAGAGAVSALGVRLLNVDGRPVPPGGANLAQVAEIDTTGVHPLLAGASLRVATDVKNPLLGPLGATRVFGPQKGGDEAAVDEVERAVAHFARLVAATVGHDFASEEGAGAAGGLAFGLAALLGARIVSGFEEVARALELDRRLREADVVLTGEGRLDFQSNFGKGPTALAERARAAARRVICFAGRVAPNAKRGEFHEVVEVAPTSALPSPEDAARQLETTARAWVVRFHPV